MTKIAPWPSTEGDATPQAIARHYLVQASHDISWIGDPDQSKDPKDTAIRAGRINVMVYLAHALIALSGDNEEEAARLAKRIWQVAEDGELIADDLETGMFHVGLDSEAVIAEYENEHHPF